MEEKTPEKQCGLRCGCIETDDPIVYEATSRPWEVISQPLGTGPFLNSRHYVATESVVLYRERFSVPVRLRGMSPPNMLGVVVPLNLGEETRFGGRVPEPSVIRFFEPGALDALVDAEYAHFILLLDRDFLQHNLGDEAGRLLLAGAERLGLAMEAAEFATFTSWLNRILTAAGPSDRRRRSANKTGETLGRRIIRKARPNPQKAERLTELLERQLPERLLDLCKTPRRKLPSLRGGASRHRIVARALEFLSDCSPEMPSVGDLCEATGAKQRTLEYAFEERFGLSPLRFVRVHRLHQARRELAAAQPGMTRVADVAVAHGFHHLSRFSQEYKRLFGEKPSQTLARRTKAASAAPLMRAARPESDRSRAGPSRAAAV